MAHRARRTVVSVAVVGLSGIAALSWAPAAHATGGTTIHVTTTADDNTVDGNCSLREAVQAANTDSAVDACPAGNGADTITLGAAHFTLTRGTLEVLSNVTITGTISGGLGTIIDGNATSCPTHEALHVNTGATVTVQNVSFQDAQPGIRNDGTLHMTAGNLDNNLSTCVNSDEANGIANFGTATLFDMPIVHTFFPIFNGPQATLDADRVFFSHNGGNNRGASVTNQGTMTLDNATFDGDIYKCCNDESVLNIGVQITIENSRFFDNEPIGAPGTITNGHVLDNESNATITDSAFDHNATASPIWNLGGNLLADGIRVSTNRTAYSSFEPGGILNQGHFVLENSTVDHNLGGAAGGILNARGTNCGCFNLTLLNDTITGNQAVMATTSGPKDIFPAGGVSNAGVLLARNTTIVRNGMVGFHDWRDHAGGLTSATGAFSELANSIVSDNTAAAPVQSQDCFGSIQSLGYNLVDNSTDCFVGSTTTGDVIGVSAHLRELAPNGGPTMTSLPPWDSPVVDTGNPAHPDSSDITKCMQIDQRGVARPRDGNADGISRCDMGAVER
ncbi:MAG TPA: CSLREA domain-containing protein [Acidimicrobiia bacterium]|jgi:CSLREA domain-containing protein